MIKSEQQKNRTLKQIEEFKNKLQELDEYSKSSVELIVSELEKEVSEYEELKTGKFALPKNITFIELLKNIAKIRIAKGLSQQDLAKLTGTTKQQINRYEEHDYQNVSIVKINEILIALGLTVTLEDLKKAA